MIHVAHTAYSAPRHNHQLHLGALMCAGLQSSCTRLLPAEPAPAAALVAAPPA